MNKKVNTAIFVVCGTLVNLVIAAVFIVLLMIGVFQLKPYLGAGARDVAVPLAFFAGLVLALLVYQQLSKWVVTKFGLSDKLAPFFNPARKGR